jgi:hypothetical protein
MAGLNKNITQNKSLPPLEGVKEEVLKAVEAWEKEELRVDPGNAAYFCPICTRIDEVSKRRRGVPRCPVHLVDMSRLDQEGEQCWRRRRKELADLLRRRLDGVLELFWRAAEAYAAVHEVRWRLEGGGELVVKPDMDPGEFRYVPALDRIDAFFYYYSPEADRILEEGARELGVGYYAEAMPHHVDGRPPGYEFSRVKMLYVKEVG